MPTTLTDFYAAYAHLTGLPSASLQPPDAQQAVGHFNVFNVGELRARYGPKPPMPYDRRAYYKISLIQGRSRAEYADKLIDIEQGLLFAAPQVPYHWLSLTDEPAGYFCVFTPEFLLPVNSGLVLDELPLFRPGGCSVFVLPDTQVARVQVIFEKMAEEIHSDYAYKYDLLRNYVLELLHFGQKLQPAPAQSPLPNAAGRVTALFAELLERQFPVLPGQPLRLRTAKDYADQLAVHVNHLNKVLKETTGHSTTALLNERLAQEAKLLLRRSRWSVADVSEALGFTEPAHFSHFFKRLTTFTPLAFRQAGNQLVT
jgi:AraC family transcriptional activator of pobA